MNSLDLVAKLLATENLTVIRANASTASFNVSTRVLTLPIWKDMSPEIETLFVMHEVGHVLYTTGDDWIEALKKVEDRKDQRYLHGYLNVVEDARIEKLVKRRFPGSRKTFYSGYRQLLERDFFRLKGKDINCLQLIDRINIYFKGGLTTGVKFDEEEKEFVARIDNCETIDEMITIAQDLYAFSKKRAQERKAETADDDVFMSDFSDEDIYEGFDPDGEEGEEYNSEEDDRSDKKNGSGKNGQNDQDVEDELESKTDKALNESLKELADSSTKYVYWELNTKLFADPVVHYKTVLSETFDVDNRLRNIGLAYKERFDKFMVDSERIVNYLVKEFEMRKSAEAYRRTTISKSGSLNMNKIHAYKLTDDIFKRISSVADGKNHGMVFLLDWSGSMHNVIGPTLEQVINLVMFCRRINIPFEVYAFTGEYSQRWWSEQKGMQTVQFKDALLRTKDKNILFAGQDFNLLNLFSSKMTTSEFQTMSRRVISDFIRSIPGYSMGATPLNEALMYMLDFLPAYKRQNNVEKLTFVTLSDGAGGSLHSNNVISTFEWDTFNFTKKVKVKNFISDAKTGKSYEFTDDSYIETEILLKIIKERYDTTVLGFFITKTRHTDLSGAYYAHFGQYATHDQIEQMRKSFSEQGFFSLKGTGRDELFVIPYTRTKIIDKELDVNCEASAVQIARKFGKMFTTKKTSRVLLDKFISYVA